jgi:hypothetical protein
MPEPISQRDLRFEAKFESWHLKFEFIEAISLDDLEALEEAQVRDLINIAPPARIDEYALQMAHGATFPPLVIAAQLQGKNDVLIDGNTRARAALRLKRDTFCAYRVSPIPDVGFAKVLAAALNQMGGIRLEGVEARKAALEAIDMGWTDDQIACEIGYSASAVRNWRRDQQLNERIDRLHLGDTAARLNKTQQRAIAKIDHDEPFKEILSLVADTKPPKLELEELLTAVQKAGSDSNAVEAISKAREDWQPIGPEPAKVHRNQVAAQARMHIGGLLKITDPVTVFDAAKAAEDAEKWRQLRDVVNYVLAMFETQAAA